MSDSLKAVIKTLFLTVAVIVGIMVVISILRVGFAFWLYSSIASWVTVRLGMDYYMSEFLAVLFASAIMYAIPGFGGLVISRQKRLMSAGLFVGGYLMVCVLVYTVGQNVYFNRVNGEPLRYFADTPDGREFSFTPGFHPRYGIPYEPYTQEVVKKEIEEKKLKLELQRREHAARQQAAVERQRKQEALENRRLEAEARKQEAERQRAQEEERRRLEAEQEKLRLAAEAQQNADKARQAEAEAEAQRQAAERQRLENEATARRHEAERQRLEAENQRRQMERDRIAAAQKRQEQLAQQRREEQQRQQKEEAKRRSDQRKQEVIRTIGETIQRIRKP